MKKIKVNYLVNYSFDQEKVNFLSVITAINEKLIKNNGNIIEIDKIDFKSNHFELYAKINFLLEKKTLKYLFQNFLKQVIDTADIDIMLSVKYGVKTLKRLISIFNSKKDFYEVKKTDLIAFLADKFTESKVKTANLTIDENFNLPEFITAENFVSAELQTIDAKTVKTLTNKYDELLNFIK